jgi:hypothetical protein
MLIDTDKPISQTAFGLAVGISQPAVSAMLSDGILPDAGAAGDWLLAYCARLRDIASGRDMTGELTAARIRKTTEEADAVALANAKARREYAPIAAIEETLSLASVAVVARFEQLDGLIAQAAPDLPDTVRQAVLNTINGARNEWVRMTASIDLASAPEEPDA